MFTKKRGGNEGLLKEAHPGEKRGTKAGRRRGNPDEKA